MQLKIKCPSCGNSLVVNIDNNKVISIEINDNTINSQKEIAEILNKKGIEFG